MSNKPDITLTSSQDEAFKNIKNFLKSNDRVFILKGYAGTGKTTLMRFLIKYLKEQKQSYQLLAPTGRASKVLSNYTDTTAKTIHSMIYSYNSFNQEINSEEELYKNHSNGQLFLCFEAVQVEITDENIDKGTIYIVDEASMIADQEEKHIVQAAFGTGRLLTELFTYDEREKSKFIFVGDPCQLPPVRGDVSPALESYYIEKEFNWSVQEFYLTQIMRQKNDSGIIPASTGIRKQWQNAPLTQKEYGKQTVWGMLKLRQYQAFNFEVSLDIMQQNYLNDIKQHGYNHSIFICRSNKDCKIISNAIRNSLGFKNTLEKGDLLMVVQNQYSTGLMNGDMVEVVDILKEKIYTSLGKIPLNFTRLKIKELFTEKEYTTLLIDETLTTETNNLNSIQQTSLFVDFIVRMKDKGITQKKTKKQFDDMMRLDPYLNALRCSYGYAVTCHKAQGGEWNNVYIHVGARNITRNPAKSTFQWLYTAITRAKEKIFMLDDFYIK